MKTSRLLYFMSLLLLLLIITDKIILPKKNHLQPLSGIKNYDSTSNEWSPPDKASIPATEEGELINYGRDLIANTAHYLGPKGKVAAITNGMNCQNCHLDAGERPYGNCFSAVASTYPTFRPRSGIVESIEFRINDCLQRSLNGKTIDSTSREMRAMVAFLKWLGKDVPKGTKPRGANIQELPFLNRAADTLKGRKVFVTKCQVCHGKNGEGILQDDSISYRYPPLWGKQSYSTGAGLYRLTRFAGYVKDNMPFGATHQKPLLTDEEAWDVAAYVNSQPRPEKVFPKDWPDISLKAIDYPDGPFPDTFPATQHKYGPFSIIKKARENKQKKSKQGK
jgi:thiosulfate dehydrogenase